MIKVNYGLKIKDLGKIGSLSPYKKFFIYGVGIERFLINDCRLMQFFPEGSSWNYHSMEKGIEHLDKVSHQITNHVIPLIDNAKGIDKDISIMPFIVKDSTKPYVLILSGGGFENLCNLIEGFPIAKICNDEGYNAFILNYHVGKKGKFPTPMDDVAKAISYINDNKAELGIKNTEYLLCGFSAGATISAVFGTKEMGYLKYNLNKPMGLILGYPFVNINYTDDSKYSDDLCKMILGKPKKECLNSLMNVDDNLDKDYPPTFIAYADDDKIVNPINSINLYKNLQDNKVLSKLVHHEKGGHGFGDGFETEFDGWINHALSFLTK